MTRYVIRLNKYYYSSGASGFHWTQEIKEATTFPFITVAIGIATNHLDLAPVEYTVEAV